MFGLIVGIVLGVSPIGQLQLPKDVVSTKAFSPKPRRAEFCSKMETVAVKMGNTAVFKCMFTSTKVSEIEDSAIVVFLTNGEVVSFIFLYDGQWRNLPDTFKENHD
jgi:hypothetical protein